MRPRGLIRAFRRTFSIRKTKRASVRGEKKWTEVDRYIAQFLVPSDPALDNALQASQAAGLPPINVSPNQGKLLMLLARAIGAQKILEIGTLGGYSTVWLARALTIGCCLITIEADPSRAEIARANVARAGLADIVEVRQGRALDVLPTLVADGPFDFVYIDADVANSAEYFQWALKLSRSGGLIVVDNVIRHGSILDAENRKRDVEGLRQFYKLVAAEPRVSMTVIQTVGCKGYDGLAIALVTDNLDSMTAEPPKPNRR
jgi:predicted O-methyltransferase YrrM